MAFVTSSTARVVLTPRLKRSGLCSRAARTTSMPNVPVVRRAAIRASAVKYASDSELEEMLKSKPGPLVVVFSATWCGPCVMLSPELDSLSEKMGDRMQVIKIDSDEYPDYCTAIGVRGLPSLYFIQDGELKYKMEGAEKAENLAQLAEHFFFDGPEPVITRA